MEWMAGVTIQLKPFVRQLWAAIYADGANKHQVYEQQVHVALTWITALLQNRSRLMATRWLRPPSIQAAIVCDASPTGGGAAIYFLPANLSITLETLAKITPMAWAARRWTAQDELAAGGWIGDPGSQARWEAYAAISTFMLWKKPLFAAKGPITVVGDALGVLFGTTALHSKDVQINRLFMELALILAPTGRSVEAIHVWSEDNALADELSRLPHEFAKPPRELEGIQRTAWPDNLPWQIAL